MVFLSLSTAPPPPPGGDIATAQQPSVGASSGELDKESAVEEGGRGLMGVVCCMRGKYERKIMNFVEKIFAEFLQDVPVAIIMIEQKILHFFHFTDSQHFVCQSFHYVCVSVCRVMWDRACGSESEEDEESEDTLGLSGSATEGRGSEILDPSLKR